MAGVTGFEPVNVGIKVRCLNQLGETPIEVVHPACLEQATFGFSSRRSNQSELKVRGGE